MTASKADGFWARAWAPFTSFVLHGGALAAVLWALQEPVTNPANTAMPMIAMEFVAPPTPASAPEALVAEAAAEPPLAEPTAVAIEPPPSEVVNDAPPVVETAVADVPMPPPPAPKPKPKVEQKPESKPQAKPVRTPAKPQPATAQPMQTAASDETIALPNAAPGPSPAAPQQAAVPVVAPKAEIAPPADYVGLLRQQLERNKVYPRSAQQRRQQGSAMLRIAIDRGGQVLSFKIEQSSGFELLDREVVAMVQRASPLPPIPAGLNTDRLEVVVPVEFFLR